MVTSTDRKNTLDGHAEKFDYFFVKIRAQYATVISFKICKQSLSRVTKTRKLDDTQGMERKHKRSRRIVQTSRK